MKCERFKVTLYEMCYNCRVNHVADVHYHDLLIYSKRASRDDPSEIYTVLKLAFGPLELY